MAAAANVVYRSNPFGIFSNETDECEEVEYETEEEYVQEGEDKNGEPQEDESQVLSTEVQNTEHHDYAQVPSYTPTPNPTTRYNSIRDQAEFIQTPSSPHRAHTQYDHAPTVLPQPSYLSSSQNNMEAEREVLLGPQPPSHQPSHFASLQNLFDHIVSSIADGLDTLPHPANEESQQQTISPEQGVDQVSHEATDVNYDMDDEDMESANVSDEDVDINMEPAVTPTAAPVTTTDALVQVALENHATVEQKLRALTVLESQLHAALPEVARRTKMRFAQRLFIQLMKTLAALENAQNDSPISQLDARCLLFWNQTLAITPNTTTQNSQPLDPVPTASLPAETLTVPEDSRESIAQSQASFFDALFAPNNGQRRFLATSPEAGPSRSPRRGYTLSQRKENTCSTPYPSNSLGRAVFRATSQGGVARRRMVGEDVEVGSERDLELRLKWEAILDVRLKKAQAKSKREGKGKGKGKAGDKVPVPVSILKKRGHDEMEESDVDVSATTTRISRQDKGKWKEEPESGPLKRARLHEPGTTPEASSASTPTPTSTSERYDAERRWYKEKYRTTVLKTTLTAKRRWENWMQMREKELQEQARNLSELGLSSPKNGLQTQQSMASSASSL